ncbi:MAG: hypothetical protein P8098_17925 [Candidatus Thiodiazotropha sp.]
MPWEFIASYLATKALDTLLFSETLRPRFTTKGLAERYQSLSAEELNTFYRAEMPLEITLAGRRYILPMSIITELSNSSDRPSEIRCYKLPDKYSVPDVLIDYTKPVLKALEKDSKSHDGQVTRLASFDSNKLFVQEASYYEGVATNFSMDHLPRGRKESLRELLHSESGSFGSFDKNPLVNHIGVICMVETGDGKLIVQKRSRKVTNRGGTLSSSSSGVVDWTDIAFKEAPFSLESLAESTFRESFEELHVSIKKIVFLGLLREFLRGGKPEVYFFARTEEPFQTVYNKWRVSAKDKVESKDLIEYEFHSDRIGKDELSRDAFKERVRRILDQVGDNANLTLVAGVILAAQHQLK